MKIAIGCDHRGLRLKQSIIEELKVLGHQHHDFGAFSEGSVDYPDVAGEVARAVASGKGFDAGILICGTGIGMSIAANKVRGIRAAHATDPVSARLAKQHNNANILCTGGSIVGEEVGREVVRAFLSATFEGGRHERRVDKIADLERGK